MFLNVPPLPLHPLPSPTMLSPLPLAWARAVGQRPRPWGRIKARLGPVRAGTSWKSRRGGKESSPRFGSIFIGRKPDFRSVTLDLRQTPTCTPAEAGRWKDSRPSCRSSFSLLVKKKKKKVHAGFYFLPLYTPAVSDSVCPFFLGL